MVINDNRHLKRKVRKIGVKNKGIAKLDDTFDVNIDIMAIRIIFEEHNDRCIY